MFPFFPSSSFNLFLHPFPPTSPLLYSFSFSFRAQLGVSETVYSVSLQIFFRFFLSFSFLFPILSPSAVSGLKSGFLKLFLHSCFHSKHQSYFSFLVLRSFFLFNRFRAQLRVSKNFVMFFFYFIFLSFYFLLSLSNLVKPNQLTV